MSSEWKSVVLKDALSRIQSGYWGEEHPTEDRSNMVRVIRNADVTRDGRRKSFAVRALSDREREKAALSVGDIALATSGEVGKAWLVDEDGYHATNFLKRLTVNPSVADPGFVRYLFDWELLKRDMAAHTGGSAIQNLRRSFFESVWVTLPPLAEQRRIADLIGSIDSYIDSLQNQAQATRAARSAVLSELLSSPGNDWQETTLGELANWFSGGTPKSTNETYYRNGTIRWAIIADLLNDPIVETAKHISEAGLAAIGGRLAPAGAVLVSMYGTIGRTAVAGVPLATNQAISWAEPHADVCHGAFLRLLIDQLRPEFERAARGAAQKNINRGMIRNAEVMLPPLEGQRRILDLIDAFDEQVKCLQSQLDAARHVRAGVLFELLSGERLLDESYDVAVSL